MYLSPVIVHVHVLYIHVRVHTKDRVMKILFVVHDSCTCTCKPAQNGTTLIICCAYMKHEPELEHEK